MEERATLKLGDAQGNGGGVYNWKGLQVRFGEQQKRSFALLQPFANQFPTVILETCVSWCLQDWVYVSKRVNLTNFEKGKDQNGALLSLDDDDGQVDRYIRPGFFFQTQTKRQNRKK